MPPRGQMAEGGGSILYFASDLLNVPELITDPLLCLSFPWISLGLQAPGSHSEAVLRWKVSLRGGLERAPGSWAFFLPPELDSWPRTLLLDPGHLWLGELPSNLGGLPGVSPIKIKGISAPWGKPTYGLRNLALRGRLPLSFLLLGKRGSRWPSPGLSAPSRGGNPLSPSFCVRPVICCGPRVPGAPLGAGTPMALGSAKVVFAAAPLSPSPVRRVAATDSWIPSPQDCANPPSSQFRPVPHLGSSNLFSGIILQPHHSREGKPRSG